MKKFRLLGILLLSLMLVVSLSACNQSADEPQQNGNGQVENGDDFVFPSGSVRVMVPFNPGGGTDNSVRAILPFAEEEFGVSFNTYYRDGAGGELGWNEYSQAAPDGHHLVGTNLPHIVLQPMFRDTVYQTMDFIPVITFVDEPGVIMVQKDSQWDTVEELIEYAKANPGSVTMAIVGSLSHDHVASVLFEQATGVQFEKVVFGGGADASTAAMGGHVDGFIASSLFSTTLEENMKTLAVFAEERDEILSDVPTMKELGFEGVITSKTRSIMVHKDTDPREVELLVEGFRNIATDPVTSAALKEAVEQTGAPYRYLDREASEAMMRQQMEAFESIKDILISESQ